jgi:phage protein D
MDLASLSNQYGQFYVPAYRILVAGRDLVRDDFVAVTQVEADLTLGTTGRFSFNIANAFDDVKHGFVTGSGAPLLDLLAFGAPVDIFMGYGDLRSASPTSATISGVITEVTTGFSEGAAPELTVSGYDSGFPLTVGKNTQSWRDRRDSDVASELATRANLNVMSISTKDVLAQIEQNQESDFEFLKKLADRNFYQLYIRNKTLYFGPPQSRRDGLVELKWGEGLLSFKPQANLASQVSAVHVSGWDAKNKKAILGIAEAGDEALRDPRGQSAGQHLLSIVRQKPTLQMRTPVYSQAEADSRAKAALNERAKEFLTGEGECIGLPEILPDTNITLGNMGAPFSRTYYVEKTTHKVDTSGYRVRFSIKDSTL